MSWRRWDLTTAKTAHLMNTALKQFKRFSLLDRFLSAASSDERQETTAESCNAVTLSHSITDAVIKPDISQRSRWCHFSFCAVSFLKFSFIICRSFSSKHCSGKGHVESRQRFICRTWQVRQDRLQLSRTILFFFILFIDKGPGNRSDSHVSAPWSVSPLLSRTHLWISDKPPARSVAEVLPVTFRIQFIRVLLQVAIIWWLATSQFESNSSSFGCFNPVGLMQFLHVNRTPVSHGR